ncbi:MAG: elongation factor G [Lachnospiraceae bacterium]|nr:elongation factor G [Lachnospiraceae bacterium]
MKVYTTDKIRNVALLGHSGSGKTSLAESMAFLAGITKRAGTIDAGNTISDYDKQEIKRKISIQTSVIPIPWEDSKINVLDTPGSLDFLGEVNEAMTAADSAIIVVSGKNGVESGTKRAWELCEKYNMPRMFFVTDMDIDDASYRQVVEDLRTLYGKKIAPFHLPVRENGEFTGYVNVIQKQGKKWTKDGKVEHAEVPDYSKEYLDTYREDLMESVAETSEEFMDRYFNGEEFSEDEIRQALRKSVNTGDIVPVMMGSNTLNRGQFTMMVDIVKYMPSPEQRECAGINADSNDVFNANYDFSLPKSAYVWKTMVDPFVGTYSFIKVNSGVLKTDDLMWNQKAESEEKIGKLYTLTGSKAEEVSELHAGDIGALSKLSKTRTTDTLSTKAKPVIFVKSGLPVPYTCMRYIVKKKGEEDKAAQALAKIGQEYLTIKTEVDAANHQLLIYGLSEQQLDIIRDILKEDYKVEIDLEKPLVAFKETILGKADIDNKYKKQTGGHGQYGHVKMTFEPSGDLEEAYVFTESVVGGNVPKNYFPAVEKGIQEGVKAGPLAGYPVVGIKANLYDGSYHPVDSSEMAFKTASNVALKKGIMAAKPILLEPIESLAVVCPDEYTGDVMGDLNKRRARVLGMDAGEGGKTTVRAEIPSSELFGYGKDLRSITGGTGDFSYEFLRYQQAPSDVQQKEVEARAALLAENADQ